MEDYGDSVVHLTTINDKSAAMLVSEHHVFITGIDLFREELEELCSRYDIKVVHWEYWNNGWVGYYHRTWLQRVIDWINRLW